MLRSLSVKLSEKLGLRTPINGDDPEVHVLFFKTKKCVPCKRALPVAQKLANRHSVQLHVLDITEGGIALEAANAFQVRSVPTLVRVEGRKETRRHQGASLNEELFV